MKKPEKNQYLTIAFYGVLTACAIVAIVFMLFRFDRIVSLWRTVSGILGPLTVGFIIAYLLNPLFVICEKNVFAFVSRKKPHPKLRRAFALILTYVIIIGLITSFILFFVPLIVSSYNELIDKVDDYIAAAQETFDRVIADLGSFADNETLEKYSDLSNMKANITDFVEKSFGTILESSSYLSSVFGDIFNQLKNIVLGLIFSVYFLASKERLGAQFRKLSRAVFSPAVDAHIGDIFSKAHRSFGGFVIAKLIDTAVVFVISGLLLWIFNIPYYPLIALIIGVLSIIPYIGVLVGGIPSLFIVFVANPSKAFWLIVLVVVIWLLDVNLISPKIFGKRIGISSVWIIIALIVTSGLFGMLGMLIGVPFFAVCYSLISEAVNRRLEKKKLSTDIGDYMPGQNEKPPDDPAGSEPRGESGSGDGGGDAV